MTVKVKVTLRANPIRDAEGRVAAVLCVLCRARGPRVPWESLVRFGRRGFCEKEKKTGLWWVGGKGVADKTGEYCV
jgi:hypothetical protein